MIGLAASQPLGMGISLTGGCPPLACGEAGLYPDTCIALPCPAVVVRHKRRRESIVELICDLL